MNFDPLERLLASYARQPLPLPTASRAAIWRRIDTQRRRPAWAGLFPVLGWRELLTQPQLAVAGLTVALVAGILPPATAQSRKELPRIARESLHLDVFTSCPYCLPLQADADMRTP